MSSYQVLARKWRPAQFADIVGQGPIVQTLQNAIRTQRIHQAYLFTGSRGIGKTSIARIFAKAIRCSEVQFKDSWLISCDQCSNCREITAGNSVDVLEIDGASNNGVDAIREIRENAKYLPSSGNQKLYIIDEVHMLTTAAFNALLKTLEEPPAHVIFIFATTEPHKIPATIVSRCQRFDFKRVGLVQIQQRLEHILKVEKISAEPKALTLIARGAEGSIRDALSLLDQAIVFCGDSITATKVQESLGGIESQTVLDTLKGVLSKNIEEALQPVQKSFEKGHDLKVFAKNLLEYLHAVILVQLGVHSKLKIECTDQELEQLKVLAPLRPIEELELIFQVVHYGIDAIARSHQPKIVLDILLVKCTVAEQLLSLSETTTHAASEAPKPAAPAFKSPSSPPPSVTPSQSSPPPAAAPTWEGFIAQTKKVRPLLGSFLEHAIEAQLPTPESGEFKIFFKPEDSYKCEQLQTSIYAEQIQNCAAQYFGSAMKPLIVRLALKKAPGESLFEKRTREQQQLTQKARDAVQNHPIIREAKALFGGELGEIHMASSSQHDGLNP